MTIFKAFLQIINKNKGILLTYSLILVVFSIFSLESNDSVTTFESTRPDIYISNHDVDADGQPSTLATSLIGYLAERSNLIELKAGGGLNDNAALDDAIFYRQINFALEIPANFEADFLAAQEPAIAFKSTGDYNASLAEMQLSRYLEVAQAYALLDYDAPELTRAVESTLAVSTPVELISHLDTNALANATYYYNFLNYPLLVGCIFMVGLVLLEFRSTKIASRLAVGAIPQSRINRILLGANLIFAFALWLVYVGVSFIIVGAPMFTPQGMMLILSSFIFALCVVALALLLANLIKSRNVLNGIVNVVGLGSSFLCGVFVPLVWLPDSVRIIAHAPPSFWYVSANEHIAELESFSWENLCPILGCFLAVLAFAAGFILLTNLVSVLRRRQAALDK